MMNRCTAAMVLVVVAACARGSSAPAPSSPVTQPSSAKDRIDLELEDAELEDAVRTLAMNARINVFVDSDLRGRVSLRVRGKPWDEVLATIAEQHKLRVESLHVAGVKRESLWISNESSPPAPQTEFKGAPIKLRLDDTPIREAAKQFASHANTTITVDDDVEASITLHMGGIPWDLALYHLAQKYELRIVRSDAGFRITRR